MSKGAPLETEAGAVARRLRAGAGPPPTGRSATESAAQGVAAFDVQLRAPVALGDAIAWSANPNVLLAPNVARTLMPAGAVEDVPAHPALPKTESSTLFCATVVRDGD